MGNTLVFGSFSTAQSRDERPRTADTQVRPTVTVIKAVGEAAAPTEEPPAEDPVPSDTRRPIRALELAEAPLAVVEPTWDARRIELPARLDSRLVLSPGQSSPAALAYRLLRHRLAAHGDPQVVAVTSPGPREGKTTCALNLALALAEESGRVLLFEVNSLRPSLRDILSMDDAPPAYPTNPNDPPLHNWSLVSVHRLGIHVATDRRDTSSGHVGRWQLAWTLNRLRMDYDFIVIDTAPVLESAEVNVVAEHADGVVLTARAGATRRRALRTAMERLEPATVIGVALINARSSEVA